MRKKGINWLFCFFLVCTALQGFAETPEWLRALARQPQKKYADDANAVVLLDERELTVNGKGEMVVHGRVAYRILRPEGREAYAALSLSFSNETKVQSMHAWSITAKGQEYETKEKDAFERSLSSYEVYSDAKEKIITVSGGDVGTVTGFEYERKHRPYTYDDEWDFQREIPVEKARFALRLPPEWEMKTYWVNHTEQQPSGQASYFQWELNDIPRIEREINRPHEEAIAGKMIVLFSADKFRERTYSSWSELAAWHAQLIASSFDSSPALQQKVNEIAPAGMSQFDKIKTLARFVQKDIRYAAIEIGIGGYKPHLASEVFSHKYGDCKDKAALLKAMLGQIGVNSYLMPIRTDRGVFTEKSPPNLNFDHVILAIQLPDAGKSDVSAIYQHPKLGRLLIFDPTAELVPFGQLPFFEQDNYALLVLDKGGELIHLPVSRPEQNQIIRTENLKLLPDGTLQGEVVESRSGYFAAGARDLKDISLQDKKKVIEHILGAALANFQVDSFDIQNADDIDKDLILKYKFTAGHYAKNAGPLLLVRPRVIGEMADYYDANKPRHYAYELMAPFLRTENVEIALPDGYKVDELPDPAKKVVPFAEYTSKSEAAGNVLKYSRQYKVTTTLVPLEKMDELKSLFGQINVDEKNMAILKKGN
jgi:hypothetical protein